MKPHALLLAMAACAGPTTPATGGDPDAGRATIERDGCNACHEIPGIHGFGGNVGPPLVHFAKRAFIAGELPNSPLNLVRWVRDPHRIMTHTAMPTLGLTEQEARDVAAYLYTLD